MPFPEFLMLCFFHLRVELVEQRHVVTSFPTVSRSADNEDPLIKQINYRFQV
jgi:hypothetical protein